MTIEEIFAEFAERKGYFPKAAVEAAVEQQEIVTPLLLEHLQMLVDKGEEVTTDDTDITLFTIFLLAQFREKRAYPLIAEMISASSDTVDLLIGDTITEGLNRILASTYNGDLAPLKSLVEGDEVDEFVRSSALRTFAPLYKSSQVDLETIREYFTSLYRGGLTREYNHVWNGLVACTEYFGFVELMDDIRLAYKEELADGFFNTLENVERSMQERNGKTQLEREQTSLIDDTVEELQHWAAFLPEREFSLPATAQPVQAPKPALSEKFTASTSEPIVREAKTGRNDPCPCGSGKKFKKCCGR